MEKFDKFYFESFNFDKKTLKATFSYSFDEKIFFEEIIDLSSDFFVVREKLDENILNNILFQIHIALGISYFKAFPVEKIFVKSGFLDDYQISFWKKLYLNGLGEFLYTNKISANLIKNSVWENISNLKYEKIDFNLTNRALVPIGGGKDSVVSIELLKNAGIEFDNFIFGKTDRVKELCLDIVGKKALLVKRKISDKLLELNSEGYYNGHVPITGIIAFVMELVAYVYDYKYLVLSNEKSANSGNVLWEGVDINHQYSKSLEFEQDFSDYVEKYISSDVKYFSLLRGMYEYKIAELFSKYAKEYFSNFSSCNRNFKIDETKRLSGTLWCNDCPKCAFVFSILRPFLSYEETIQIFGEDLYEKKSLEKLFRELLGISGIKPFECVGEAEEVILGMYKTLGNYKEDKLPYILEIFKNEVLPRLSKEEIEKMENKLLKVATEDIIPKEIKDKINFV